MGVMDLPPVTAIRERFTVKLVLLLLIVALIVGGFGSLIYAQTDASLEQDVEGNMEHAAVLQAETLTEGVQGAQTQAVLLAHSGPVQSGDTTQIRAFFDAQADQTDSAIAGIHYVDTANATIEVSTVAGAEGDASDLPWMHVETDGDEPEMVGPYEDPLVDTQAGAIVMDAGPDTRIVVLMDLIAQSEELERPTDSEDSGIHVITEDGLVLFSHDTETVGKIDHHHMGLDFVEKSGYIEVDMDDMDHGDHGHEAYHDEQDAIQASEELGLGGVIHEMEDDHGHTVYVPGETHEEYMHALHEQNPLMAAAEPIDGDGHDHVMAMGYAQVEGADWIVMSHEPVDDAFALQSEITRSVIGLILVSFLGLGLIGAVVGRNTSRSIRQLADSANELEHGNLDASLETTRRDEIGQLYGAFDSMRTSLRESIEETESARARAERRGEELADLATHLQAKAEGFRDVMVEAGEGDLTARMNAASENEAMEAIALEYNEMMDEIESTTIELKRFAEEVAAHSEEVTASTEEVQTASSQVTDSVQQISTLTDKQHETFQIVVDRMEDLSATTEEVASLSSDVAGIAERTAETGTEGRAAASDAVEVLNSIDDDAEAAVTEIERLQSKIVEIEEITDFIQNVAKQTNMLALNANIEASRSGESDEGFSAVAEEVKELATDVQESAAEIDDLVEEISSQTDRTADEVRQTREDVEKNADAIADAIAALDEIAEYANQTHDGTQEISAASQQQAASIEDVVELVDEAEAVSERVSEDASTAAAAAEEQTTALSEVTESAGDLAERSGTLQNRLDEFETDEFPEAESAPSLDD